MKLIIWFKAMITIRKKISKNYLSQQQQRGEVLVHWCQIVQQVPVEWLGRLRVQSHDRSGRAPLGSWYTVSAVLTHILAHFSVWSVPGQPSGQPPL